MKIGDKVSIIDSEELSQMRLDALVGREGVIEDIQYNQDCEPYGCWVSLFGNYYEHYREWFIPLSSIGYDEIV